MLTLVYAMQSSCAGVIFASPSAALTSARMCSCASNAVLKVCLSEGYLRACDCVADFA